MKLFFDPLDVPISQSLKDSRFEWLKELGAEPIDRADPDEPGFLFGYQNNDTNLARQTARLPSIRDTVAERNELINLDDALNALTAHRIAVPTPKTWVLRLDDPLPDDIEFPLFLRTRRSSWKRGGQQSKVRNPRELQDECELLRRTFGWNTDILARKWLDLAVAGTWMFGSAPQEIRTWVVDGAAVAWSFHYLHVVPNPTGFPPSNEDLQLLKSYANEIARAFSSRLIAIDFVRDKKGTWHFLEAGPGAICGTAHKRVFQYVAKRITYEVMESFSDNVGGTLE